MTAKEIRRTFLDFFHSKGHIIVPSAPLVIKNDPTLLFTNAGMNQFKDLFLGNAPIVNPRVADTQKCLRVSGKHNDLEEVGVDTYHHTLFEMLGNWSFGDYFKKEAIHWSWELLTEVYKMDKSRIYVTVFEGSTDDGLAFDQEAYDCWKQYIAEDRILKGNKKDNFWEMGDVGPCGPCSEIHVDMRSDSERARIDGKTLVNANHPQVIEIWNNVFMEFNRKADGSLEKLPAQHVDTGMGFERLCMVLQGKQSNYDTDVFQPLIRAIETLTGARYGKEEKTDIAIRVVADHIRAVAFAVADGQLPSSNGAGYVIRRILRRAVRYAYSFLETREPLLCKLVPVLVREMGDFFTELAEQQTHITLTIEQEEKSFLRTLENGIARFEKFIQSGEQTAKIIPGAFAFELYDTFGFPIDLTQLMARENQWTVDEKGFQQELEKQKARSRQATTLETDDWVILQPGVTEEFVGYDSLKVSAQITRYRKVKAKGKTFFQLVLDRTPFYPEGGGQVGDAGYLEAAGVRTPISDTRRENNLIVHTADMLPADPSATFLAVVDASRRCETQLNHSATHLLHEALREVLGTHVEQKGSLVNAEYLRFDFSHIARVTEEELARVEKQVNEKIRENLPLDEKRGVPIEAAKAMGAMALFGEKYGDSVRVIRFGSSVELCGGTHVQATGQIGLFKIVSESAVAAGVRRIEAFTGQKAFDYFETQRQLVTEVSVLLKNPKDLKKAVTDLVRQQSELQRRIEELMREKAAQIKTSLLEKAEEIQGVRFISASVDLDAGMLKELAYQLKGQVQNLFLVLASENGDKASLAVMIDEKLVSEKGWDAGKIVRELAREINGGGGGQAFFATAGGTRAAGIPAALEKARAYLG